MSGGKIDGRATASSDAARSARDPIIR